MITRILNVSVTADHLMYSRNCMGLNNVVGTQFSPNPIVRAIRSGSKKGSNIRIHMTEDGKRLTYGRARFHVPRAARRFVKRFTKGKPVAPATFTFRELQ